MHAGRSECIFCRIVKEAGSSDSRVLYQVGRQQCQQHQLQGFSTLPLHVHIGMPAMEALVCENWISKVLLLLFTLRS